jgi:hypothetical protein
MNHFTGMAMASERQAAYRRQADTARQVRSLAGEARWWRKLVGHFRSQELTPVRSHDATPSFQPVRRVGYGRPEGAR